MNDFEFEDLLDSVLRENAEAEPLAGSKSRILSRVSLEARRSSRRWMSWAAMAGSAASIGLIIWIAPPQPQGKRVESSAVLTGSTHPNAAIAGDALKLEAVTGRVRERRRASLKKGKDAPVSSRERPLEVKSIAIIPLAVEPIEIASLTME